MESSSISDFPKFADGDVVVVLTSGKAYQLHATVMRRNSTLFAEMLTENRAAQLLPKAKKEGVTVRYRMELSKTVGVYGTFEMKEVDSHGRSATTTYLLPEIDNGKITNEQYKFWDNLFRAFYNRTPDFDDTSLATVLHDCMGVIDVAESIGAVEVIQESVDIALLRQGQVLFRSIAANALAWSDLGRRVHSPSIYKEAIIHLVGQWNAMPQVDVNSLHSETRELCERKHKELDLVKQAIEIRMLGHSPAHLQRHKSDRPGRASYGNDIYIWMCTCYFRQWYAQCISEGRNRVAEDGGYELYQQIGKGGQAYLDHETFFQFHKYFPMSAKGVSVLENNMFVMKEELRPFVHDLLEHRAQYDITREPLPYLTCCIVEKADFPWVPKAAEENDAACGGKKRDHDEMDSDAEVERQLASEMNGNVD